MAENKYITQTQENGQVLIAEEVLVNIISVAVAEVEGAELSGKPGINWGKGIKLTIDEENRVAAEIEAEEKRLAEEALAENKAEKKDGAEEAADASRSDDSQF